ncbi:Gfo/Idh/MocA family protein [Streptomyces sp. NPDC001315]|uniref:Gfo/Idh/MocA family protein n=1 Tax=Streptomyces sp. NPDC001315 TaxID=3364562 RepID=UPI0036A64452
MTTTTFATLAHDRPLRAAIAGAGFMGGHWARILADDPRVTIAGWADTDEPRARAQARANGLRDIVTGASLPDVLDRVRPDMLVNCTVPEAHMATTLAALERGLPVLSEKPMAADLDQARRLVAAADDAGQLLMVSQNRRYLPGLTALRDAAAHLGELSLVTTDLFLPHHPPPYVLAQPRPLLQEMAVHLYDAARALTGAEPEEVRHADSYRTPWSWFEGDDSLTAHIRMSGALRYTFTGCWSSDGRTTSWNGDWQVIGALGTAHWDGEHSPVLALAGEPPRPIEHLPSDAEFPGLAEALDDFLTALHTGTAPQGECHDNLRSLAMVDATLRSAITGRPTPVTLEPSGV